MSLQHVTPNRIALKWLSARRRREYLLVTLAVNILRRGVPRTLAELFLRRTDRPDLRVSSRRPPPPLLYETPRTEVLSHGFLLTASRLINTVPFLNDPANPPPNFKWQLKAYFPALDVDDWRASCTLEGL